MGWRLAVEAGREKSVKDLYEFVKGTWDKKTADFQCSEIGVCRASISDYAAAVESRAPHRP